jgi:signal transduction histidine kinase/DNA-binding response OmpR family regulator
MTSQDRPEPARDGVMKFDLGVLRNHFGIYVLGFVMALIGRAVGAFPLRISLAFGLLGISTVFVFVLRYLRERGTTREVVNATWMTFNILFCTFGIYATGGIESPWYIWYIANASGAAFAQSKRAAYIVSAASTVAYLGLLLAMGQIHFFDHAFSLAFCRMLFSFGASYFFLVGVANLREKRVRIRQLEAAEKRKIQELTILADELRGRSEELADANRRIREADRLKSQFLANMSHELRTPMNSIIGFSEILVERLEGKVERKHLDFLQHILTSGQHLLSIINDVLDLSKIEAGKMEVFPETFDVKPVIESVCSLMRGMTPRTPHFVIEVAPGTPKIETDLAKFKQVLFNLLSNAVKFAPADRPITIRAAEVPGHTGHELRVAVQDEGIGIDEQHHEVIFQEFRQVDGTVRREYGGTGLGLALVKKFVELQGGMVGVDSHPGVGSTFWFTLPFESQAAVVNRAQEIPGGENGAERVLVVEDDANAYDLIASALASAEYMPVRARHGEEALRLAREVHPVAITLDLVLPGLDGWEVLKRLKADEDLVSIPVVIISVVDNRELGVALGAEDYFVKPVERERFVSRVRAITASHEAIKPRLLLIDDDPAVHTLLREELEHSGYSVVHAYSGEEGLKAAGECNPDLIILDLMMPGMSGFEVAGLLKQNPATANISIVVLTSKDITPDDRNQLKAKVATFVQKGKSAREQLVNEIRRLCSHRPMPPPA